MVVPHGTRGVCHACKWLQPLADIWRSGSAVWLGLVPRQCSSGGKPRLHGISRRGDTYLRTLLIHGARAVLRYATTKADPRSLWLQQLIARRGHNCAAVALANKNGSVIQALLSSDSTYMMRSTAA